MTPGKNRPRTKATFYAMLAMFLKFRHLSSAGSTQSWKATLMARPKSLEKMSVAELSKMQADIERMRAEKQNADRAAFRDKIMNIAKESGFDIHELFERTTNAKGTRGKV